MPVYEYECQSCKKIIEEFQDINDEPLKKCKCGGKLKKKFSAIFSDFKYRNANELYENEIKPDVDRISKKINEGDDELAANIFGVDEE